MGKFDGILICTDLDGTLYRKDKTISEENKEAIEYFKREGGYFTFVTGRMPYYSQDAYNAASPNVAFGCINGGGLYDGEKGEYVSTTALSQTVVEIIEAVEERFPLVGIQICCFDRTLFAKENSTTVRFREITGVPPLFCNYHEVKDPVGKVMFCSDFNDDILEIEKILRAHPLADEFDFVRSERTLFEILPKGVNKGLAIEKLVEYLGIDIKNTFAIGDYNNDIGMFYAAGFGIAVANACPEAIAAADYVTVSNEEHAIARLIYDIEAGIYKA